MEAFVAFTVCKHIWGMCMCRWLYTVCHRSVRTDLNNCTQFMIDHISSCWCFSGTSAKSAKYRYSLQPPKTLKHTETHSPITLQKFSYQFCANPTSVTGGQQGFELPQNYTWSCKENGCRKRICEKDGKVLQNLNPTHALRVTASLLKMKVNDIKSHAETLCWQCYDNGRIICVTPVILFYLYWVTLLLTCSVLL